MPSSSLFEPLLRTLAAVPVSSHILDLGCGPGHHTEALLRLGFPVHACDPDPDAVAATRERITPVLDDAETAQECVRTASFDALDDLEDAFDWVVAVHAERLVDTPDDLDALLTAGRRLLKPGGWMYLAAPAVPDDCAHESQTAGDGAPVPTETLSVFAKARLNDIEEVSNLALSSAPEIDTSGPAPRVHAIYRHVATNTPV